MQTQELIPAAAFAATVRRAADAHAREMVAQGYWKDVSAGGAYSHAGGAIGWALGQPCGGNAFTKVLLMRLAAESDEATGLTSMTLDEMADGMALSPRATIRAVKAALNVLKRLGLVREVGPGVYAFGAVNASVLKEISVGARGKITLFLPQKVRLAVLERDGHKCRECGAVDDLQVDHIRSRAKGGCHDLNNLQVLCGPCNQAKGAL